MIKTNQEIINIECMNQLEKKEVWLVQEDFSILKITEKGFKKMHQLPTEHVPILHLSNGVYEERFNDFCIKGNFIHIKTNLVRYSPVNNTLHVHYAGEIDVDINEMDSLIGISRITKRRSFYRKLSDKLSKPLADFLGLMSFIVYDFYDFRALETLSKQCPSIFYIENLRDELPTVAAICSYSIYTNRMSSLGPNHYARLFGTRDIELSKDKHYFYSIISQHHFDFFEIMYYEYLTINDLQLIKNEQFRLENKTIFKASNSCIFEQISHCVQYEDCLGLSIQRSLENGLAYIYQLPYINLLIDDILAKTNNDYKMLVSYINFYDYQPLIKSLSSYLKIKPYFKEEKLTTKDLLLFGQSRTIYQLKEKGYDSKKIEYFLDVLDQDAIKALSLLQDRAPLSKKKQKQIEEYMMKKDA